MLSLSTTPTHDPQVIAQRVQSFRAAWPTTAQKCNGRLEKAQILAAGDFIQPQPSQPGVFTVRSESNPAGAYTVDTALKTCTCPDHGRHSSAGIVCKHRLAVALVLGWSEAQPQPEAPAAEEETYHSFIFWAGSLVPVTVTGSREENGQRLVSISTAWYIERAPAEIPLNALIVTVNGSPVLSKLLKEGK